MKNNPNILVVGASIAGPMICYWLKKYGFNPTLIERNKSLRTGGYAIDIRGIAVDVIKKMGIYDDITAKRTSLLSKRNVDADGHTISEEHGERAGFRDGGDVEIVRGELVNILVQAIPDIPCLFDEEIINLTQMDMGVDVTFKDGRIERYDLLIAADGMHSSTRNMVFSDEEYTLFDLDAYFGIFNIPNYLNLNRAEVSFSKARKCMSMHSDKDANSALVGLTFRPQTALHNLINERAQKKCLSDFFYNIGWESNKILELMNDSDNFYFDVVAQIKMDAWTKGRVALLGDAGYCASPLSGQGTNLAIIGAYILAGELNSENGDYSKAFARYNALMRPLVDTSQDLGIYVADSYLAESEQSKEMLQQRSSIIMKKVQAAANSIALPDYEKEAPK